MSEPLVRAWIYARLSRNRTGERSASTERQERDCRALIEKRGWSAEMVVIDDDRSAFSARRRPGYENLMASMAAGQLDAIVAWHPDRLHRSPKELEEFIDAVEESGVEVATVQTGRVDLSTPSGRMHARIHGSIARYESEHRSARTAAAHEQIAAEGRWKGGRRPFGYHPQPDGSMLVDDAESAVIREAWQRVVDGVRPGTIANDFGRREIPTAAGGAWSGQTIRSFVVSPTVAGRRVHRGVDVGEGRWPAILTLDELEMAKAVLAGGEKRGRVPRVALLSGGRVVCDKCITGMRTFRRTSGKRMYRCSKCWRQIAAEPLEEWIEELVVRRLDKTELPVGGRAPGPVSRTIVDLEALLAQLADDAGNGVISYAEWMAARRPVQTRLAAARSEAADRAQVSTIRHLTGRGVAAERWPGLSLEDRQAVVSTLIAAITIAPGRIGGGQVFDHGRVDVDWR